MSSKALHISSVAVFSLQSIVGIEIALHNDYMEEVTVAEALRKELESKNMQVNNINTQFRGHSYIL